MNINHLTEKYPNIAISYGENDSPVCLIDSRVHGLYACFHCILYGLYICEEEGIKPLIALGSNHLYYDNSIGENIFTYFYKQDAIPDIAVPTMTVTNLGGYLNWVNISIKEKVLSNLLIKKYFILNDAVTAAITRFQNRFFSGNRMLGVHYRGTDKISETPLLHFSEYVKKIDYLFNGNFCDKLFFATDELELRTYVKNRYGEKAILYDIEGHQTSAASIPSTGLHFIEGSSPYLNARNAIMEAYLLAGCDLFISSHKSSMSVFVTFINPDIIHIILEP